MTSIFGRIFPDRGGEPAPSKGDRAYAAVMDESDEILRHMRESSRSTDAARAVMADIWQQNHNVPFLTTVYESVQEAKSGPESDRER